MRLSGASSARHSPRPLMGKGGTSMAKLARNLRRDRKAAPPIDPKISNPLTSWKPSSATNERTSAAQGNADDLPRTTHPVQRMVVDGRPPAACGDCRADAGRDHPVAGGEPRSGDADRARSVPL